HHPAVELAGARRPVADSQGSAHPASLAGAIPVVLGAAGAAGLLDPPGQAPSLPAALSASLGAALRPRRCPSLGPGTRLDRLALAAPRRPFAGGAGRLGPVLVSAARPRSQLAGAGTVTRLAAAGRCRRVVTVPATLASGPGRDIRAVTGCVHGC